MNWEKTYAQRAAHFFQKAAAEAYSENVIANIAADYYTKAGRFYVMDKNEWSAAYAYEKAAMWYLEDGDVSECCNHLLIAARCLMRINTSNEKGRMDEKLVELCQKAATFSADLNRPEDCASAYQALAVYYEKTKQYQLSSILYEKVTIQYKKGEYFALASQSAEKTKEMHSLFTSNE